MLIGNGGADVIRGGAGDDMIAISDLMFAAIDGGTGDDTLRFDGAGMVLDFTSIPPAAIQSIERIDLSGTGPYGLIIDAQALFDLTEERGTGEAILIVNGDAGDNVTALGFTATVRRRSMASPTMSMKWAAPPCSWRRAYRSRFRPTVVRVRL